MSTPPRVVAELDTLLRDLDLVVFRLERELPPDADRLRADRRHVRRELERLKDRLDELVRSL